MPLFYPNEATLRLVAVGQLSRHHGLLETRTLTLSSLRTRKKTSRVSDAGVRVIPPTEQGCPLQIEALIQPQATSYLTSFYMTN